MKGTLYGVGVGPGDPELMTLKALRIINEARVIAAPEAGVAIEIASKAADLRGKELLRLHLPMTRDRAELDASHDEAAAAIIGKLDAGSDVAFLTLGDPSIYSTFSYIQRRVMKAGHQTRMAEGITSFCAAAARLNEPLCEGQEALHIVPASCTATDCLSMPGTKVLMKAGKALAAVKASLKDAGLAGKAAMVERCGMENERICRDLDETPDEAGYFSIIIVRE